MNTKWLYFFLILFLLVGGLLFFSWYKPLQPATETLSFYPLDKHAEYVRAQSNLQFIVLEDEDEYTLEWSTTSTLDQKAYIRQDFSFLFEDGRLRDTMSKRRENSDELSMKKKINGEDSGHFQIVTFHHSELHYPNDYIKSKQMLSIDELYVIDSPLAPVYSFKVPSSEEEKESKKILDKIVDQQLTYAWGEMIDYFNINGDNYHFIPLTRLKVLEGQPLPGLSQENTNTVISIIWKSLYENYYLGVNKGDGTVISPIGSTIPLILYAKKNDHFIILYRTKEGEKVQLIKTITL